MKCLVSIFFGLAITVARGAGHSDTLEFHGTCDASAATALSGDLFVVANDEDNILRFYRTSRPGDPVQKFDLHPVLATTRKAPEVDLEGAARLGQRVFFISSHGRNAEGKSAPNRHRFFALEFTEGAGEVAVKLVGKPYVNLATDLASDPRYQRFQLAEATRRAPKAAGGFNIEALTDTPEGTLLIGFRSPIPQGRALLVPLLNPNAVVAGDAPKFGEPLLLDLGGLGLRGIASTEQGYYVLAGPDDGKAPSRLFFSAGRPAAPKPIQDIQFPKINPEGICLLGVGGQSGFLILSDDGSRKFKGKECKSLPESERRFRAYIYTP